MVTIPAKKHSAGGSAKTRPGWSSVGSLACQSGFLGRLKSGFLLSKQWVKRKEDSDYRPDQLCNQWHQRLSERFFLLSMI